MAVASSHSIANLKLNFPSSNKPSPLDSKDHLKLRPAGRIRVQPQKVDFGITMCESCNGIGWLLCEFCKGQKINVKTLESNRIYRRCPACKSIGSVLCSRCKVFKCVTFPDQNDGESLAF
ncbi:hypothetical protein F511_03739 [Dorcoceras hygrometricum]|uniref:Uncharacterized protein n=1 Tax=Dorcoceras hygrometricum TaxID=472368 RepID=A0A2Z7BCC9_9LAMI|nr:hypothetical protein F511_03739 [Dorcoceras hygrometricum]